MVVKASSYGSLLGESGSRWHHWSAGDTSLTSLASQPKHYLTSDIITDYQQHLPDRKHPIISRASVCRLNENTCLALATIVILPIAVVPVNYTQHFSCGSWHLIGGI